MLPDGVFNADLRDELSQGDVIEFCPTGAVAQLVVARIWSTTDPGKAHVHYHPPTPTPSNYKPPKQTLNPSPFAKGKPESILFEAKLQRCMVMSNDCVQLAKASNQALAMDLPQRQAEMPWHVAPIVRWPSDGQRIAGTDMTLGQAIERGQVKRYLGLPAFRVGEVVEERSYVDLRFLTPLKPILFTAIKRLASLTDFGVATIWRKMFEFFSGKVLPVSVTCAHCGKDTPVVNTGTPPATVAAPLQAEAEAPGGEPSEA